MYLVNSVNINTGAEGERLFSAIAHVKKPEIRQKLMRLQGQQEMPFLEQVRAMYGESVELSRNNATVFEDTDKRRHVVVSAMGAVPVAPNYTTTLTIDPGAATALSYIPWPLYKSYMQYNQNSPYPAGLYGGPVQLNDLLLFPENQSVAQVIEISNPGTNTSVLTVRFPGGAAGNVITASVAGKTIPVIGNAYSEGSGQPKGKFTLIGQDTHYLTISKESAYITGDQETDQLYITEDSEGNKISGIKTLLMDISDYDMYKNMSLNLLFGPGGGTTGGTTPYLDPTTSLEPIKIMEGTVNYIKRRGLDMPVAPGTLSIQHFEAETAIMIQRFSTGHRMIYVGNKRGNEINEMLRQANAGTWVRYAYEDKQVASEIFKNNESLAYSLNYSSFMVGTRVKYIVCSIPEFDVVDRYNDDLQWAAMIMPYGVNKNARIALRKDEPVKYMQLAHKGYNSYNRFMEVWQAQKGSGGDTKNYNSQLDSRSIDMRSHYGCLHNGGLQMTWLHK